jgi:hypothetical protein
MPACRGRSVCSPHISGSAGTEDWSGRASLILLRSSIVIGRDLSSACERRPLQTLPNGERDSCGAIHVYNSWLIVGKLCKVWGTVSLPATLYIIYSVYVCLGDCELPLALFQVESLGCLFSPHHVNQDGVQKTTVGPQVTLTTPTLVKSLSGDWSWSRDAELAVTGRYCLVMRAKRGNSCWCFFHH